MATTADTLITEIRRRLADVDDEAYSNDLLIGAMNEGATIFSETTGCCQAIHNFTSGSAISSLALSGLTNVKYINVYAVEYASGKLDFAPRYEAAKWTPSSGTPAGWSIWGDILYLDTIVTLSSTNDIDVSYTYIPDDMTSTSSNIGIADKWLPAIKAYARFYIHDLNRETGLADRAWAEFILIQQAAARINEALMSGGGYS